jgi:hypothetical protein
MRLCVGRIQWRVLVVQGFNARILRGNLPLNLPSLLGACGMHIRIPTLAGKHDNRPDVPRLIGAKQKSLPIYWQASLILIESNNRLTLLAQPENEQHHSAQHQRIGRRFRHVSHVK